MTPGTRRTVITLITAAAAFGIVTVVAMQRKPTAAPAATAATGAATPGSSGAGGSSAVGTPAEAGATGEAATAAIPPAADDAVNPSATIGAAPATDADTVSTWRAVAPAGGLAGQAPPPLGGLDPRSAKLLVEFAPRAAGVARIVLADFWETAVAKRQAAAHWRAVERGDANPPALPDDADRYVLQSATTLGQTVVPLLGVHSIEIDDTLVSLFGDVWSCKAAGEFVSEIRDGAGTPMLRVQRTLTLGADGYDLRIAQSVENLTDQAMKVRWIQYGPFDLRLDASDNIDPRRFHFGFLMPPARDPSQSIVSADGQLVDHSAVVKSIRGGNPTMWPNADSESGGLTLSWIGATNRYFAFAAHAPHHTPDAPLVMKSSVEKVLGVVGGPEAKPLVMTELYSPEQSVAPGKSASFDMGVYAGPLDPRILGEVEPYRALGMSGLIVYMMSTAWCCNVCTFPILARILLTFLSFLHDYVVFDWALAIIVLVLIVRTILHPITKRAQVSMMRTTRGAAELKPELEKLQERYKGDAAALQRETMRLYREKGVNPVGCIGGLLPTFLQMPIWIALYAMLYFAIELRQQPAFFGVFQLFGGWQFLGDLSASDHFLYTFKEPVHFLFFPNITGINLLPILMGLVFFFQQKYMTPPSTVKLTPEQEQQQKITKWMMVIMFPLMMYSAPSGLTLYMLTSSLVGIVESKRIRKHMAEMDLKPATPKQRGKQDKLGRLYEEALARAAERQQKKKNPPRKFKER